MDFVDSKDHGSFVSQLLEVSVLGYYGVWYKSVNYQVYKRSKSVAKFILEIKHQFFLP